MTDAEKILLAKAKNGDIASFERLIEKHQKTAYNIALRTVGNEEDAKDLTQDALIKVYKNIHRFREDSSFTTWLYRIVVNTCKDEMKKKKLSVISIDKEVDTGESQVKLEIPDESSSPERVLETAELNNVIQDAINTLPEQNRIAVVLRDIQGFSYEDISKLIDCPVGTVKSRINRGRKILRDILKNENLLTIEGTI